ncbi:hypothetical protein DEO72_LG4g1665 [Vigna unguiculata]|uniref:Uncharacterized protein n=1 Tax=Vigna unguiculata TaxID=3917 RepID=A0A4D6LQN6_VIGUN|nr:hypothetical protein DEO72_LG4g1665 [Vigna unguiculata]
MGVHEELEEAKAEIQKLKHNANLLQNMKKSYDAHTNQILEAIFKIENLNQQLFQKEDETNGSQQRNEDLTDSAASDELGADCDENFRKWKDEKRRLLVPFEEEKEKIENQEQLMRVNTEEIESRNGCIPVSNDECLKIENNLKTSREIEEPDAMFQKLEEENMKVEEQLKWKEEQFKHQEEENETLREQFKASKEEWEMQKNTLLDEISSLQLLLDNHERKADDLQHQLVKCKQALADEENQRKFLEDEVSNLQKEKEEECFQLMKQLELKDELINVQDDINEAAYQLFEERVEDMEADFKEQLKEAYDALDRANIELDERICETSEIEYELRMWKSLSERLKNGLEVNLVMRQELENSLLDQVHFSESLNQEKHSLICKLEDSENEIDRLQQHVFLCKQEPKVKETEASSPVRGLTSESSETVEVSYLQIIEEKNKILEEFQKEVLSIEQESNRKQFESAATAQRNMGRTDEGEEETDTDILEGNNNRTDEIMQQVTSLEQKFTGILTSISSQLFEKQAEIIHVKEACNMITAAEVLAAIEIEEKKFMIEELEDDICDLEQKLELQEVNLKQSEQLALDVEEEMNAKQFKAKELVDEMEKKLRDSDAFLEKVKIDNRGLLESATRLSSSERESLLSFVEGLDDKMYECTVADTQLMDRLRRLVESFEDDREGMDFRKDDELIVKENMMMHSSSPGLKKSETFSELRSPFKELNV